MPTPRDPVLGLSGQFLPLVAQCPYRRFLFFKEKHLDFYLDVPFLSKTHVLLEKLTPPPSAGGAPPSD